MRKLNILFVTEKWCDGNSNVGLSNSHHNLFGSLDNTGLATISNLYLDECRAKYGISIDSALEYLLRQPERPDAIIFCYLGASPLNPTLDTIKDIYKTGIPMCFIWPDIVYDWAERQIQVLEPYATLHVSFDTQDIKVQNRDKFLALWVPQDDRLYYPQAKDIPVSFCGSVSSGYPDRPIYLKYLLSNGIDVYINGGQRENRLSAEQYAEIMRRSLISINFSASLAGKHQCKGRVFEIAKCGSLLLESRNEITPKWFEPRKEYIDFKSPEDLLYQVQYYLEHKDKATNIGSRMMARSRLYYNNNTYWETILGKLCGEL